MSKALNNVLRVTQQLFDFSKDSEQAPIGVRHSLELVNICDQDLRLLIELRDQNLDFLEKQPAELIRVNNVIEKAYQGLADVCKIVDNCRPDARGSRTQLRKRVRWFLVDSREFQSLEPVISCQHAAVLSELNLLRQIALWGPIGLGNDKQLLREDEELNDTALSFDNIGLLGDILGDISDTFQHAGSSPLGRPTDAIQHHQQTLDENANQATILPDSTTTSPPSSRATTHAKSRDSLVSMPSSWMIPVFEEKEVVEKHPQSTPEGKRIVIDSNNDEGLLLLFGGVVDHAPRPLPTSLPGHILNCPVPSQISLNTRPPDSGIEASIDAVGPYGSRQPSTLTLSSASLVSQGELEQQRRSLSTYPFGVLHYASSSSQMNNLSLDHVRANSTTPSSIRPSPQSQKHPAQAIETEIAACCNCGVLPRHSEAVSELSSRHLPFAQPPARPEVICTQICTSHLPQCSDSRGNVMSHRKTHSLLEPAAYTHLMQYPLYHSQGHASIRCSQLEICSRCHILSHQNAEPVGNSVDDSALAMRASKHVSQFEQTLTELPG